MPRQAVAGSSGLLELIKTPFTSRFSMNRASQLDSFKAKSLRSESVECMGPCLPIPRGTRAYAINWEAWS
ncbi:hypothetical protein RRG08_038396 [Elysia crispata]|uniref:Uncharacterized protein n=1 Tax=Elysia crispata TaxID=231223 RepID=A0AAE1A7U8_9GAST|nr:hypothetical protein RRG08_038396 [Elysia crispata]